MSLGPSLQACDWALDPLRARQASLKHLLEATENAPSRQILILTPNDYHASLTGPVCKPQYDRLMAGGRPSDEWAAIQIKHMPRVERG